MPIKTDRSDLPYPERNMGTPPDRSPMIVPIVAQRWYDTYLADGNDTKAHALPGRRFRASWAGKRCDRSLQYALQGVPASNPPSLADHWRFGIGTMVHEIVQTTLPGAFPNSDIELPVDLRPIGIDGSASTDIVLYTDESKTQAKLVVELKSINGFGFKNAATTFKGPPEGPKYGHIVQGALAAAALNATDGLRIGYLSLENLSPNMATYADNEAGRFCAEWHFPLTYCKQIARQEAVRISRVTAYVDLDGLSERALHDPSIPDGAVITDPKRGMWSQVISDQIHDAGSVWFCGYCDHRDRCIDDGPGGYLSVQNNDNPEF
jgi:hypothetical protein